MVAEYAEWFMVAGLAKFPKLAGALNTLL
jgi:hypothetical protein